jgi:hypothetical protein
LKSQYDESLSNFAFNLSLCHNNQVRQGLIHENLRRDYAASKIKEECWDTMVGHRLYLSPLN